MPIDEMLARLDTLAVHEARTLAELKQLRERLVEQKKRVAEAIHAGETTGVPLKDFVLAFCSGNEEIEQKLKGISEQLEGRKGKLVLASYRYKVRIFFGGPNHGDSESHYVHRVVLYLGVLSGESLVFDIKTAKAALPTGGKHIRYRLESPGGPEMEDGDLGEPKAFTDLVDLAEMVMLCGIPPILSKDIELVFGDQEVIGWILSRGLRPRQNLYADFYRMSAMLGKRIENDRIASAVKERIAELRDRLEELFIEKKQIDLDERRKQAKEKPLDVSDLQKIIEHDSKVKAAADEIRDLGAWEDQEIVKLRQEFGK